MQRSKWVWQQYDSHTLNHCVPSKYAKNVKDEMLSRGSELEKSVPCPSIHIDVGGICAIDRPIEKFKLLGLTVEIPSEDVGMLYTSWKVAPLRDINGAMLCKLKGFCKRCIVVDEKLRKRFLASMELRLKKADWRAEMFYKKRKEEMERARH